MMDVGHGPHHADFFPPDFRFLLSAFGSLGTTLDGQTDKLKRTEFVCPSSTRRSTARQISQKEQNSSVLRRQIDESISIAFSSSKSTYFEPMYK